MLEYCKWCRLLTKNAKFLHQKNSVYIPHFLNCLMNETFFCQLIGKLIILPKFLVNIQPKLASLARQLKTFTYLTKLKQKLTLANKKLNSLSLSLSFSLQTCTIDLFIHTFNFSNSSCQMTTQTFIRTSFSEALLSTYVLCVWSQQIQCKSSVKL